jgi:hypothetical protein
MPDRSYGFDRSSQRFRDLSTGRFVSEREVRDAVDRLADLTSRRMGEAAARYRAGQITSSDWLAEHLALVKQSQIASALAAYGGRANMTPERWGLVGYQIRVQYAFARKMAADVLSGRQRMNGRLDARARQYGQAARVLYENIRAREAATSALAWERNVRHASESCQQCRAQSAAGWVPRGTLVPVGARTCRSSCRCSIERAATRPIEEEAA